MNGTIRKLSTPAIVHAADRVQAFIDLARDDLDALIPSTDWSADIWQVGQHFVTKGQNRSNRILAFYNRSATISNRQEVSGEPLDASFKDFAKAYIRYTHSTSPIAFENELKRLEALRLIEAGFRTLKLRPEIESLNVAVLNTAIELAKENVGPARHYQFAVYVQQVYKFCMERHFLVAPFQWKHGVRKPKDRTEEIGANAREWRDKKLPSPEAYNALAHVFRNAETVADRLFSAVCAICISIPIRAHEVLQLREDCEVKATISDGEISAYGIRVWPGKGQPPQVKWVPTQMASVVQEAVQRLRDMCANARGVAKWYEQNPGVLWLPPALEHCREEDFISLLQLQSFIGVERVEGMATWVRSNNVEWDANTRLVMISSLADAVLPRLPSEFPLFNKDDDQLYSDTLILMHGNEGHAQRATFTCLVEKVTVTAFEHWLSGHDGGKKPSVFKSWGFTERDGSDIEITTHAFRHWLNTVAQLRGMSELDIAKWSGRDASQNKAYNHVTPEEILSQIRLALDDGNAIGPMFEPAKMSGVNQPVSRREFIDAQIGAALVTDFGICVHDYSLLPCQSHGDCLGCSESVFIKGDRKHEDRVTERLSLTEKQLGDARKAMSEEHFGADRWVETHLKNAARMQYMLSIHGNAAIPDGTVVNLPDGAKDNEIAMAARDRLEHADGTEEVADDADMRDALSSRWDD